MRKKNVRAVSKQFCSRVKERYEAWQQSEEDAIRLLSAMIRRVNAMYES